MSKVTMLELRQDAESVIDRVQHGEELTLTYRGKPVMTLQPLKVEDVCVSANDPLLQLAGVVSDSSTENESGLSNSQLSNSDMDALIYGL